MANSDELVERGAFLFRNLPAVVQDGGVILFDYFGSRIARVPLADFRQGNLPDLHYDRLPCEKRSDPTNSVLTLILNRECNMRCTYCFADGGERKEVMSHDCIRAAVRKVMLPQTCQLLMTFFGGEPTLCLREIEVGVHEASKYSSVKKQFAISTNGVMSDKTLDYLVKHRFAFNLSMDGLPEVQNKQRPLAGGGPSSAIVERTIRTLVENTISFKVRATITSDSVDKMPDMVRYLAGLGVKYVHLEAVNLSGRADRQQVMRPPVEKFVEQFQRCSDIAHELNISLVNGVYTNLIEPSIHSCSAVTGGKLIVTPEGNISRCYEVQDKRHPYSDMFIVGRFNPFTGDFDHDPDKIDHLFRRNAESSKGCGECFAKYICSGGCVMRNLHGLKTYDINQVDPYQCTLIQALLKDAILRIYRESRRKVNVPGDRTAARQADSWITCGGSNKRDATTPPS